MATVIMSSREKILIKFEKLTGLMAGVPPTPQDVADYIRFFFEVPRNLHPHDQFELRLNNKRKDLDDFQENRDRPPGLDVWHLLHGYLTNFYRTQIPVTQNFPIVFSPYTSMAVFRPDNPAFSEFPGVAEADLPGFLRVDTDGVYLVQARINGQGLAPVRMVGSVDNVDIPKDNVLGIPDTPGANKARVYYDGYFVKLDPLPPGDHLIESKGYAPNFENDVRYSVYTRAGVFP
jgi:hypothetical protein